jgi:DNA primase
MGTALTQEQLAELGRSAPLVILALDADRSGQEAMLRASRAAEERGVELRMVEMPEGTDPAELVARAGPEAFAERLESAMNMIQFQVRRVLADADLDTPAGRDRALDEAGKLMAAVPERTAKREALVREVADRLDMPLEHVLAAPGRSAASGGRAAAPAGPANASGSRSAAPARSADAGSATRAATAAAVAGPALRAGMSPGEASLAAERAFLAMCLAGGELGREYLGNLSEGHLSAAIIRAARDHLVARFDDPLAGLPDADPALAALVTGVVMTAQEQGEAGEPLLRMSFLQLELRRIERELRRAAQDGDHHRQDRLAGARQDVRREMDSVMGQTA